MRPAGRELAAKAVGQSLGDPDADDLAEEVLAAGVEVHHAVAARAAARLPRVLPGGAVHQHFHQVTLETAAALGTHAGRHLQHAAVAIRLHRLGHLFRHLRRRRAGAAGVAEGEDIVVPHRLHRGQRLLEVRLRLAGEPHDEIGGERELSHRRPELCDQLEVARAGIAAVHALEDPVGAGLQRQVEVLHHLGHVADGLHQARGEIVGIRGGEADALDSVDAVHPLEQRGQVGGGSRSRP